jgi:hypothetical protein
LPDQLIPEELLQRSWKILFISHLAIGDFAYLQKDTRRTFFIGKAGENYHQKNMRRCDRRGTLSRGR